MRAGASDDAVLTTLTDGMQLLAPVLAPHGFRRDRPQSGGSSGGPFASAAFVRGDRSLAVSVRGTSVAVDYRVAGHALSHAEYMRALLGPAGKNGFPAYADDVAVAFAALRSDIELYAADFVAGPGEDFRRCWARTEATKARGGFSRLADAAREIGGA